MLRRIKKSVNVSVSVEKRFVRRNFKVCSNCAKKIISFDKELDFPGNGTGPSFSVARGLSNNKSISRFMREFKRTEQL